jgi:hypothetical protein
MLPLHHLCCMKIVPGSVADESVLTSQTVKDPVIIGYSVLKFFTGFASAALIAWKLTVINAMNMARSAAAINTHTLILMR